KLSFINAVSRVCEQVGADAVEVAKGMGMDPRIGASYLQPGIGFGGFCLPKDVEAFRFIAKQKGYDFDLLRIVKEINEAQRTHFVGKIREALGGLEGKKVALWGISFKPHTDDIRFAPSLEIAGQLQAEGARLQAYDPEAMEKARTRLPGVSFCA